MIQKSYGQDSTSTTTFHVCRIDEISTTPYVIPSGTLHLDKDGHRADEKVLIPTGGILHTCGSSFRLFFKDEYLANHIGFDDRTPTIGGSTLGLDRRNIACQVYAYIASKINMGTSSPIVLFDVSVDDASLGWLAGASPYYPNITTGGIPIESYNHQYITTSIDPIPGNAHSIVQFNFATRIDAGITYTINSTLSPPSPTEYDLYSILLHEATHTLDFLSLINNSGNSNLRPSSTDLAGPYSYMDKYLVDATLIPKINVSGSFIGSIGELTSNNLFHYKLGNSRTDVPVYSPRFYALGSSLSHIDNVRDRENFVMNASSNPGYMARTYTSTEEEILCNLGYTLRGGVSCSDHYPVAVNDVSTTTIGTSICVPVLANDYDLDGIGTFSILASSVELFSPGTFTIVGNTICYAPPAGYCGGAQLSYIIVDNINGRRSNTAFVNIDIPCTFCPDDPCNLICNGDFEDGILRAAFDNIINYPILNDFQNCPSPVANWCSSSGSPDLFIRGSTKGFGIPYNYFELASSGGVEVHSGSLMPNDRYTGALVCNNLCVSGIPMTIEGMSSTFTHNLNNTDNYKLDFWTYNKVHAGPNPSVIGNQYVKVYLSNVPIVNYVPYYSGTAVIPGTTELIYSGLLDTRVNPLLDNSWQHHTLGGITTSLVNARYIVFEVHNLANSTASYTFFDDVRFELDNNTPTITSTVDNPTPHRGDIIHYTYRVCNPGTTPLTSVVLNCTLPAGLTYVSGFSGGTTHTIPTLAAGSCVDIVLTAQVDATAPFNTNIDNCCTLPMSTCTGTTGATVCNSIRLSTTDIQVVKTVISGGTIIGGPVSYQIAISNISAQDAHNIVVNDLLASCLSFNSYTSSIATPFYSSPIYNNISGDISIAQLNAGYTVYITINAILIASPCINTASLSSLLESDINVLNNTSSVTLCFNPPSLAILTPDLTSTTICNGRLVHLTSLFGGTASTYQWSTGAITPDVWVTVTTTNNIFSLTVTDIYGCQSTATISFTISPSLYTLNILTPDFTSPNICNGEFVHLTNTYSGTPASYLWSTAATTPDIWVNPTPTMSTYSLTVTDVSGCINIATINFIIGTNCCTDNGGVSVIGTDMSSSSNVNAASVIVALSSSTIKLNGTLVINNNTILTGKTFRMGPNAKIIINDGKQLSFVNCTLDACTNYMWDGIYINRVSNAATNLTINSSSLISAKNAVVSINGGNYTINNNTNILRCYKGLVVNSTSTAHTGTIIRTIIDNPFNATLLPPYNTRTTTYHGIEINNVASITIGDRLNAVNKNIFNNLDIGIQSWESNTNVYNNAFTRIFYNTAEPISGIGVYAIKFLNIFNASTRNTLQVGGIINPTDTNYFDQVALGVYAKNTSTKIYKNNMRNMNTGIKLESDNRGRPSLLFGNIYDISLNKIYAKDNGIFLNGNPFATANIYLNFIYMPAGYITFSVPPAPAPIGSVGIRIADITSSACAIVDVNNNYIRDGNYGIFISNNINSNLSCNTSEFTYSSTIPTITGTGISLQNSDKMKLYYNKVYGNGITKRAGIQLTLSKACKLESNEVYSTKFGLVFDNDCASKGGINANKMVNNQFCLSLRSSGIIDAQIADGTKIPANEYTYPSGTGWGTFAFSSYGGAYDFWVGGSAGSTATLQPTSNGNSGIGSSPFVMFPQLYPKYTNPRNCILPRMEGEGDENTYIDETIASMEAVATGDIEVPVYNEMSQWTMEYKLYKELKIDTILKDSSEILNNFYEATAMNNIGLIADIHEAIADRNYTGIATVNTAMNPDNIVEANAKLLMEIYLRTIALDNYNFDGEDISNLEYIANQCPFVGGLGVYQARAMLGYVYDNLIYDDNELCLLGSFKMAEEEEMNTTINAKNLQIYPNPAKDLLNIYYTNKLIAGEIEIEIYDITGKKIISKNGISNQLILLDVSLLSDAFYQLQIKDINTLEVYNAKFMVSKK